jgi:hypothetical protein
MQMKMAHASDVFQFRTRGPWNQIPDKNDGVIQVEWQFFSGRKYMQLLICRSDRRAVKSYLLYFSFKV